VTVTVICHYDHSSPVPQAGDDVKVTGEQLTELYQSFARDFDVVSIEDPFDQDDWETYPKLTAALLGTFTRSEASAGAGTRMH
jgi:enolase